PPSNVCVLARVDRQGTTFSTYDLARRGIREFARVESDADWDLFQDGSRIAVLIDTPAQSRISIIRLSGEREQEFPVDGSIQSVYCSADGKGLYLPSRRPNHYVLLYMDLRGRTRTVWQPKYDISFVRASPDGRYLSLSVATKTRDAWLLENF